MCGINGMYGLADRKRADDLVSVMNNRLAHRGPDDAGLYSSEFITLGHRRLSIIDLSKAGHQPFTTEDGRYTIVYNGELYNYKELRLELQRISIGSKESTFQFRTQTDTEVVLAAFIRWGKECLQKFNGMFAFGIWDAIENKLLIARDRLGIKPLYYYSRDKLFVFSSELRPLLSTGLIPLKTDSQSLADYLRYQTVHAPRTIIKGVGMLLPGHCLTVSGNGVEPEAYWDMASFAKDRPSEQTYKETCDTVLDLLLKAVERRLVADVPFGAFLSGGIDSSAVVALMSKVAVSKVRTFSVTFEEKEFNEAYFARLVAGKYKTEHEEIKLKVSDFLDQLPEALHAMDHPGGDGINTYVVSKATRKAGVTMALSGLGGDELFAGYPVFPRTVSLSHKAWIRHMPGFVRSGSGALLKLLRPGPGSEKVAELLRSGQTSLLGSYPLSRKMMTEQELIRMLKQHETLPDQVRAMLHPLIELPAGKLLSGVSFAEMSSYMQNVLLRDADQMSMSVALEVRVPFLDHKLVEYVLGVPDKYKYPHTPKKLLVDSLGDLLPPEIVNRPKMGFTFPWKKWMSNELLDFCAGNMKKLSGRNEFQEASVLNLWNDFLANDPRVPWSRIWYLVVLEHWLTEHRIDA
ncbi:MAG: asparagine synthase (glutamine-hydrolyzing) [Bacteroidia bacterium]